MKTRSLPRSGESGQLACCGAMSPSFGEAGPDAHRARAVRRRARYAAGGGGGGFAGLGGGGFGGFGGSMEAIHPRL